MNQVWIVTIFSLAFVFCIWAKAEYDVPDSLLDEYRLSPADKAFVRKKANESVRDLLRDLEGGSLKKLALKSDIALEGMVSRGVRALREAGDLDGAYWVESEYEREWRGAITRLSDRNIGDHKPLIQWIDTVYKRIIAVIGVPAAKALHLSDLWVLDMTIPVVFRPCTFEMDLVTIPRKMEYQNHFAEDPVYYGLVPTDIWWLVWVPCTLGSSGIGALFCSPIAMAAEFIMGRYVAPPLSDKVFDLSCS